VTTKQPRWLNDDERQAWVGFVGLLLKLPQALDSAMRQRTGLTHFEYVVMSALSESVGRTRPMSELAELTNASLSRLSHVVAKLEQHGWVHRSTCPHSGRVTLATLTDAGMAVVVDTAPQHVEAVRALVIDALEPSQLEQLATISGQLLSNLEAGPAPADPAAEAEATQSTRSARSAHPATPAATPPSSPDPPTTAEASSKNATTTAAPLPPP
jgi:DNA-binding MarR family transcriptional regulator